MFIFNKYTIPFDFKNKSFKNEFTFANYNLNFKNNSIHSTLFILSLNFYFFLYNHIIYKNSFKYFLIFNPFLLFFISKKSFQKIINY